MVCANLAYFDFLAPSSLIDQEGHWWTIDVVVTYCIDVESNTMTFST